MVSTRMEGRVDNVERDVSVLKADVTQMKEWMLEMKDTLGRLEKKGDDKDDGDDRIEDEVKENSNYRKLELPLFDGDEAIGWLFRVERYFSLNRMRDAEKLEAVAVCLEGRALNWLQWLETRMEICLWQQFKSELLRRFHQSQKGNNYEMLMALKQTGTVSEYREQFELLSAPLKEAPEEMLIGAFQNGLKEEIRAEIRMVKAHNLMEVMDLAQKVEEKNRVLAKLKEDQEKASKAFKIFQSTSTNWTPTRPNIPKSSGPNDSDAKGNASGLVSRNSETRGGEKSRTVSSTASTGKNKYKRLTDEEMARKRANGECFTCDEKYSLAHKCKNKHLHVLILSNPIEEREEEEMIEECNAEGLLGEPTGNLMELSMNSIVGITGGRTMKIVRKVRGEEVMVMIDSGASHNFISSTLVDKLQLPVKGTSTYEVTVGDGHKVKGEGVLDKFSKVCKPLQGLPPSRSRDHAILVKEGAAPPNIRPYRYPHSQKSEIEKLVKEIVDARAIAYFSQLLSNRARKCSVYERELMAIVFAVKKWRHYLLGHKFVIRTDQKALKYLLEQRIIDPDQQKWASKLMGYSFEIQYKPGVENKAADALSRRGETLELKAFSVWKFDEFDEWEKEVQEDPQLTAIVQQIITGQKAPPGYGLQNGFLVYKGRLVVPKGSARATKLIEEYHSSPLGARPSTAPLPINNGLMYKEPLPGGVGDGMHILSAPVCIRIAFSSGRKRSIFPSSLRIDNERVRYTIRKTAQESIKLSRDLIISRYSTCSTE
ncbi:Retrotransposable element Tf2 [Senna tora]|uniref:Retrotransposable element Tf2 n=1 Tax=Senna tora TaxID=362788 RepID=A0A834TUM3_9FABA|nr:Retrotransposable element Tf2 [Senna tora]